MCSSDLLIATFRGKRESYKRSRIRGNQDARGQREGAGSHNKKGRDPEGDRYTNHRALEGQKSHLLTRGLQETHEFGGLNVKIQNITSIVSRPKTLQN